MFKKNILTLSMAMISFNAFAGAISANNNLTNAGEIVAHTGRTASEYSTYSYQLNQANIAYNNCLSSFEEDDWSDDGWFFGWYTPCKAESDAYNALLNQAIKTPTELEQTTNVGQDVATLVQQNSANKLKDKQILINEDNNTAFTVGGLVKGITPSALISRISENPNSILTTINQPRSPANTKERSVSTKVADLKLSKEALVNRATYITNFANQASIGQGVVNGGTQVNNGGILNLKTDDNVISSSKVLPILTSSLNVLPTLTSSTTDNQLYNNSGSGLSQIMCPNGQVVFSIANCDSLTVTNGYIDQTGINKFKIPSMGSDLDVIPTLATGVPIFK